MTRGIAHYRKLVRSPAHVAAALRMMANWKLEPLLHDLPRLAPTLVLVAAANDRSISPVVAQQVQGDFAAKRSSSACRRSAISRMKSSRN